MESTNIFKTETIKSENKYEEEPMDTNETFEEFFEEGEINSSDDETPISGQNKSKVSNIFARSQANNYAGFSSFEDEEIQKKEARAKRFALPLQPSVTEIHQDHLSSLYRDLGIDKENERHYRFNTIHMRGTENMSTEEVFDYFALYSPSHIEWINDVSCNIVWMDDVSAARALLNMSKKIKNLDKVHLNADPFEKEFREPDTMGDDGFDDDSVDARHIKTAIPPGFWRMGVPSDKSSFILLRYATRSDKKQKNAEKNSEYYKKYGNPNYGNLPGILSKSLRSEYKKSKHKDPNNIWKRSSNEGEVSSSGKKNPWEELAYEWGKTDKVEENDLTYVRKVPPRPPPVAVSTNVPDLRISLTNKKERRKRERLIYSEDSPTSSDKEWESKSKMPRMKMYADDEEKRIGRNSDKKLQGSSFVKKPVEDLRSKINGKKNRKRFKFKTEKEENLGTRSSSSISDNDYDDGDSGDWALEQYYDLRESLGQNKKYSAAKYDSESEEEEEEDEEENDNENEVYRSSFGRRSPLQIEIDNDEYYQRRRDK